MSRTVQDLIEVLRAEDERAVSPEPDTFLAQVGRRRRRRRRRAGFSGAVALAVLVVLAVPAALARPGPTSGQAPTARPSTTVAGPRRSRPVLTSTLRASTVSPWRIVPYSTMDWMQLAYVDRSGSPKGGGSVIVYEPGAYDPAPVRAGLATTVAGHPGFYAVTADLYSGDEQGEHRTVEPTIAWEYAPGAWAVVHGTFGEPAPPAGAAVPATLRRVAAAVVIGEPVAVDLPFRLRYVPAGIHPVAAGLERADLGGAGVDFDDDAHPHDWRDPYRWEWASLSITLRPQIARDWHPDTTLGGLPAMSNGPNQVILQRDGYWLTIGNGIKRTPLPRGEVERIFAGMVFADWRDDATWFDATAATSGER